MAAGYQPVDLNNRFITSPNPELYLREAEELGLSRTLCAWIKGIYAWCLAHPEINDIVAVTQGDCSNTHALMELLSLAGKRMLAFDFPLDRDERPLAYQISKLAEQLGTDLDKAEAVRKELEPLRRDLAEIDRLTWQEGKVSGLENNLWLLESSDFNGDPGAYAAKASEFLREAKQRGPNNGRARLGLLGVPPIMSDLHQRLEELGGQVVYNEIPRQFAMLPPDNGPAGSLVEQYRNYTYPYNVFFRLEDIKREVKRRRLDGLVHYTQSFCYRQMQDIILREKLRMPILTLEGDRTGPLDSRTKMRLEAFIDLMR